MTRVALKRRIDAGRLMAQLASALFTAVCHNFGYPICVIGSAGCGEFPLWFVMPCYAHGQVASVVCYAVLCHGRVECLYTKGTLICRGSTRVYPVESYVVRTCMYRTSNFHFLCTQDH